MSLDTCLDETNYDGRLVEKSYRPLPFVNKENRDGGGGADYVPLHEYEGQKHPMTNRVKMEPFFLKPLTIFTK